MNSQDLHNLQEAYMDVYSEGYKPPRGKMTKRIAHKMFKGVNTLKTAHDSGEDLAGRTTGGQIASQKSEKLAKQAQKIYQTAKRHDPESSQRRERENRTVGQIAKGDPVSAKVLRDRYKKRGLPFKSKNNTTMKAIRDGLIDGVNDALGEEVNIYDIILSHLLDEGYAETQEQAEVIMVNMSEDWRESIMEAMKPLPVGKMIKQAARHSNPEQVTKMAKVADTHNPNKSQRKEDDNRREGGRKREAGRPRRNELQDNW